MKRAKFAFLLGFSSVVTSYVRPTAALALSLVFIPTCSYEFDKGVDFAALMASYRTMGFQATNVALAADEMEKMVREDRGMHHRP